MKFKMSNKLFLPALIFLFWFANCTENKADNPTVLAETKPSPTPQIEKIKNSARVIHVFVALCDNENQGIVPVPAFLGNGEDPAKNLYWGAAFGIKTFFSKSAFWQKIATIQNPKENILERIVFKHRTQNGYLVADAYRGSKMRETIDDFLTAASGAALENILVEGKTLQIAGSADLTAFVGHNGLMDFKLDKEYPAKDESVRDAIILACASRQYFTKPLRETKAKPLLWTSNLMAPEAYILHDAVEGWIKSETDEQIRNRAANAYSKYQRIGLKSARNLLVTGW